MRQFLCVLLLFSFSFAANSKDLERVNEAEFIAFPSYSSPPQLEAASPSGANFSASSSVIDSLEVNIVQIDICDANGIIDVISPSNMSPPYNLEVVYPNSSIFTFAYSDAGYTLSNLNGGLYEITVYSGGDTSYASVDLPQIELNTNFYSPSFLNGGYNVSCYGACDAELFINLINPSETYTVDWYNDEVSGTPFYTSTDVSSSQNNLCAGEYAILFTSSTGCESIRTYTIREPDSLYFTGSTGETLCDPDPNGFVEVDVFGGVGNTINNSTGAVISFVDYTFSWAGPDGYSSSQEDISSLEPGSYTLTVEDNNGCTYTDDFTVEDNVQGLELTALSSNGITCNGGTDGSLEVGAAGGQAPYEYRIDGGAWQSSGAFSSLSAGNYTLEVRDANDCIVSLEVEI